LRCHRCEGSAIEAELATRGEKSDSPDMSLQEFTNSELRMLAATRRVLHRSNTMISNNEYLFSLFESDVVLRIPLSLSCVSDTGIDDGTTTATATATATISATEGVSNMSNDNNEAGEIGGKGEKGTNYLILNIEVDGAQHKWTRKLKFCELRDAFFMSRGVAVKRIEYQRMCEMTNEQLDQWVMDSVSNALVGCLPKNQDD
jgi:hypothetical protein